MMTFLYIAAAVTAYLVAGWNPAITFSKAVYGKDIRTLGSGNPGFTNFKRNFGNLAWLILVLDLSKGAAVVALFAVLFGREAGLYELGAVYTGLFAVLGHSFPVWYGFKGGKGFLVGLSTLWVADWRVGGIATLIMIVLLLTTKYMSLSTVTALVLAVLLFALFGAEAEVIIIWAVTALFVFWRHRENFRRLFAGKESKFSIGSHKHKAD